MHTHSLRFPYLVSSNAPPHTQTTAESLLFSSCPLAISEHGAQAIGWTLFSASVVCVLLLAKQLVAGVGYCLRCWALAAGALIMATQLVGGGCVWVCGACGVCGGGGGEARGWGRVGWGGVGWGGVGWDGAWVGAVASGLLALLCRGELGNERLLMPGCLGAVVYAAAVAIVIATTATATATAATCTAAAAAAGAGPVHPDLSAARRRPPPAAAPGAEEPARRAGAGRR